MTRFATLTPNPAIDLATEVERVVPHAKLRCGLARRDAGGGGINVARILTRWRCDVVAIYPVGGFTGQLLRSLVEREKIVSRVIRIDEDTREDFTVTEETTGNQYRFVQPGTSLQESEWKECIQALQSLDPKPKFVIASGSVPPDTGAGHFAAMVRTAKSIGARVVVDTSGGALNEALAEKVYLAKPNLRELRELTGSKLETLEEQLAACRGIIEAGQAEIVTLSLAEDGAIAVTSEGAWRAEAPDMRVVSAVGAGDSFLATMVWRLDEGDEIPDALRYGVAAGSAALLTPGTELCHVADVNRLLADVTVEAI